MKKLGVLWKIQDTYCSMATDIFKIKEEMTEKVKPESARHLKKLILYLFPETQMHQRELREPIKKSGKFHTRVCPLPPSYGRKCECEGKANGKKYNLNLDHQTLKKPHFWVKRENIGDENVKWEILVKILPK